MKSNFIINHVGQFVGFTDHGFSEEAFGFDNEYDMPMVGWLMYLLSTLKK